MNGKNATDFLNNEIQTRWPKWQPNEIEVRDWLGWLENYDYDIAEKAANTSSISGPDKVCFFYSSFVILHV